VSCSACRQRGDALTQKQSFYQKRSWNTHTHLQVTWWHCSFDLQSGEQLWNASESVYFHVDWWLCSVDRHKRSQYNTVHVGHINDRKRESGGHINAPLASFTHSSLTPVWCKDYWSGLESYICYGIIANTSSINNGSHANSGIKN
jgi:hypothetical protein